LYTKLKDMKQLSQKDIKKYYEDIIEGFHSGIPECCILQYILDLSHKLQPLIQRQNTFPYLIFPDWVPCDNHCRQFIQSGLPQKMKELSKNDYFFWNYNEKTDKLDRKKTIE